MSIQKKVEGFISERPSIRDGLKKDLVNYSKLARMIIKESRLKGSDFDAVLAACRRASDELGKTPESERDIREIIRSTQFEIRYKMAVFVITKNTPYEKILKFLEEAKPGQNTTHWVGGVKAMTLITEEDNSSLVKRFFNRQLVEEQHDLVEIVLKSSSSIEAVPGVMAYLFSLMGELGINIVETMSCWTDTIFVIKKDDLERAVSVLKM